jgi:glycosyltransferase involved in cell wall biosynthesis
LVGLINSGLLFCYPAEYPLVSVIIPTYERPQFLAKAVDFIKRQGTYGMLYFSFFDGLAHYLQKIKKNIDYPNIEIVIVDDSTVPLIENSELTAVLSTSNVRYIYLTERLSIGAKRNIAVEQASGWVVAHWDDDDYFREHRISAQVAPIIRGDVDMTVLEHYYYYILSTKSFYIVRRPGSWGPHFGTFVYCKVMIDRYKSTERVLAY